MVSTQKKTIKQQTHAPNYSTRTKQLYTKTRHSQHAKYYVTHKPVLFFGFFCRQLDAVSGLFACGLMAETDCIVTSLDMGDRVGCCTVVTFLFKNFNSYFASNMLAVWIIFILILLSDKTLKIYSTLSAHILAADLITHLSTSNECTCNKDSLAMNIQAFKQKSTYYKCLSDIISYIYSE